MSGRKATSENRKTMVPDLSMISLFSGAGGMDLGLEAVGFNSVYVTDIDDHCCRTLEAAKRRSAELDKPFLRFAKIAKDDIRDTSGKTILRALKLKQGEIDLLCGGPPCQAFSVFGKRRGREDPRGSLVFDYLRIISEVKPKAFVFENVYGLLTIEGGQIFRELCERLRRPKRGLRYELSIFRLNAADYGVPQHRDRVFIIGHSAGLKIPKIPPICGPSDFLSGFGLFPQRTVAQALRGLPPIGNVRPPNHFGRTHSERIITRYASMSPGQRDSHTRINKLDLTKPSFTIIVGSDAGGGKGHIHPIEPREVTPRESARIQTFPDWWDFSGTSRHPIRQVGNAVPPLLAAAVGNAIRTCLFGRKPVHFETILKLLDQEHLFPELLESTDSTADAELCNVR
jgi:DNA (cytosine-5)-methyltransferase 1